MPLKLTSLSTAGAVQTLNAWADSIELLVRQNTNITSVAATTATAAATASSGIPATAAGNEVFASPNGFGGPLSVRPLVGPDLPFPGATSLGGVKSFAPVTHQWLTGISTGGTPSASQPTFADIAGIAAVAQGGTGTATPSLVAGSNISITGSWPNQTVATVGATAGPYTTITSITVSNVIITAITGS
jgi:hypothetical protein